MACATPQRRFAALSKAWAQHATRRASDQPLGAQNVLTMIDERNVMIVSCYDEKNKDFTVS